MKKFLALVLSLCLVLSLAACGGKTADDDTGEGSKTGGTIQVGLNSAPVSMNIWCQNDLNSATIMNLVCPNLVAIDDDGNKYDYLTESSESNEDCTVWTIKLKELYWNDGTPVTSADLLFTAKYGVEHHIGFFDSYYGLVDFEKSSCPDERTVEFALTSGNVNFWKGAGNWIPVMRESEWSSVEEPTTYSYSGAGYGPYYISEWVDGEYVTLKRNPYFTQANDGAGACIDEVVFRVYTDENAMVLALQNGEVDVCANFLSASSISQLQSNSNYQIESVGSLGYTLITFSQTNELLQDVNVRKALAASCDREALVNVAMSGAATPMYTPISPVYSDFTASNIRQPEFDTAAAASILENAGYVDTNGDGIREKDGVKLTIRWLTYPSRQELPLLAESAQATLKDIGIDVDINCTANRREFLADMTSWDIYASAMVTAPSGDPQYFFTSCCVPGMSYNFGAYENTDVNAMIDELATEFDTEKRGELAVKLQQTILDDNAYVFCSFLQMNMISKSTVTGYTAHACDYYQVTADLDING